MLVYVVRRLLAVIPVMLVVATVSFILIRLAPGDPASVIAGPYASGDDIARLQRSLGLDQALPVQLVKWWGRLARGDLGDSIFLRRPVLEAIFERMEPTLLLTAWSMLVVDEYPIETGEAGNLDRHRRTKIQKRAGKPFACEHSFAEISGKFHGKS